jgi:hypothetical protein
VWCLVKHRGNFTCFTGRIRSGGGKRSFIGLTWRPEEEEEGEEEDIFVSELLKI